MKSTFNPHFIKAAPHFRQIGDFPLFLVELFAVCVLTSPHNTYIRDGRSLPNTGNSNFTKYGGGRSTNRTPMHAPLLLTLTRAKYTAMALAQCMVKKKNLEL